MERERFVYAFILLFDRKLSHKGGTHQRVPGDPEMMALGVAGCEQLSEFVSSSKLLQFH